MKYSTPWKLLLTQFQVSGLRCNNGFHWTLWQNQKTRECGPFQPWTWTVYQNDCIGLTTQSLLPGSSSLFLSSKLVEQCGKPVQNYIFYVCTIVAIQTIVGKYRILAYILIFKNCLQRLEFMWWCLCVWDCSWHWLHCEREENTNSALHPCKTCLSIYDKTITVN